MLPFFALSRALVTFTAQNYGAGKNERLRQGLFQTCLLSLGIGVFMAVFNWFTAGPISSLFIKDNLEAVALAKQYLFFTGFTVFILGIMLTFRSFLQGIGMRRAPTLCAIMETAMSILAVIVLIPKLGFLGVCLVNPLSWLASGITIYIAYEVYRRKLIKNVI